MIWQTTQTPQNIWDIFKNLKDRLLTGVPGVVTGLLVFLVFWIVASVGARVIAYAAPRAKADTGIVILLSRVYYYTILIFGLITALSATGLNISALVTGLGLTGFAIGFALKDVLSNLLSGIMLLLYRPFRIGDNITMGQYSGVIQTIQMRDTILKDAEGRLVIIPNSKLITEVVVNNSTATKPATFAVENIENKPIENEPAPIRTEPQVENASPS